MQSVPCNSSFRLAIVQGMWGSLCCKKSFKFGEKTCESHPDPYPSLACSSSPLMAVKDFHFEFQNYVNRRALKEKNYKINHCFKARCEVKSSFPVLSILVLWPTTCRDGNRFEKKTHYNYTLKCFCWKKTLFRNEPLVLWHQLRCIFRLGYFLALTSFILFFLLFFLTPIIWFIVINRNSWVYWASYCIQLELTVMIFSSTIIAHFLFPFNQRSSIQLFPPVLPFTQPIRKILSKHGLLVKSASAQFLCRWWWGGKVCLWIFDKRSNKEAFDKEWKNCSEKGRIRPWRAL